MDLVKLTTFFSQTPELQELGQKNIFGFRTSIFVDPQKPEHLVCQLRAYPKEIVPPETPASVREDMERVESDLRARVASESGAKIVFKYESQGAYMARGPLDEFVKVILVREAQK